MEANDNKYRVSFQPIGRRGKVLAGQTIFDSADEIGLELVSLCGGRGSCGKCRVKIVSGQVSEPTSVEIKTLSLADLDQGIRLACQAVPVSDLTIHIPPESMTTAQRVQLEGVSSHIEPDSAIRSVLIDLSGVSTYRGIVEAIGIQTEAVLQPGLSVDLDLTSDQARVAVRDGLVVAVGPEQARYYGLAVDLGTTKLAAYLIDLETGETVASKGAMNPQISVGEDVIARIDYHYRNDHGADKLQKLVVEAINGLAVDLAKQAGCELDWILDAVIVGNTAMHHLLMGLPVKSLGLAPYVPAVKDAMDVKASTIGLKLATEARLHTPANLAGFVGGDHTAVLLAMDAGKVNQTTLIIDVGTNTEVSLIHDGTITCASCASGPAFEGAHISQGMRAAPGAIERVAIEDGQIKIQTIGESDPVGLCGSGLIDVLAQLVLSGIVDPTGRLLDHQRVREVEGNREFVLVEETIEAKSVSLTQKDIRELQLSKSAIATGIAVLMKSANVSVDDLESILLAGAFGSYIDPANAMTIGLLPDVPIDRIQQVGNSAGTGARMMTISMDRRREADLVAERVGYEELASSPNFMEAFVRATKLGRC